MDEDDYYATFDQELHPLGEARYPILVPQSMVESREEPNVPTNLPYPRKPMSMRGPAGWMGNYRKRHDPNADQCYCQHCYIQAYPFLVAGDPVQVHPQYPADGPHMQEMVGLYDHKITRVAVHCERCGGSIEIDSEIAAACKSRGEIVTHVSCLPDDTKSSLNELGYSLPYFVSKVEASEDPPNDPR